MQPGMKPAETVRAASGQDDPRCDLVLSELKTRIGVRPYALWFENRVRLEFHGEQLQLAVGSPFLLTCIQKQFRRQLTEVARLAVGPAAIVALSVDGSLALREDRATGILRDVLPQATAAGQRIPHEPITTEDLPPTLPNGVAQRKASVARRSAAPSDVTNPDQAPVTPASQDQREVSTPASRPGARPMPEAAVRGPSNPRGGRSQYSGSSSTAFPLPNRSRQRKLADLGDYFPAPIAEIALTACRHVATAPGTQFNPLFLYGSVGTGKTHLLEGICRQLRKTHGELQVMLLTAEAFSNYFTQALNERSLPSFRHKFRGVDVLLVDDVDFFESKRVFQEEFLHTLGDLADHGRQVVVTADRHPRLLTKLGDDLVSRFQSGLICRLETPDVNLRKLILARKVQKLDGDFAPEALNFVAERFSGSVRELEGALNCLQTYHGMTKKRVSLTAARQVLADLERDCLRVVRLTDIERVVCQVFGLKPKELKSDSRVRTYAQPRMLAMFLARKHTQSAYSEIGQHFGGRNHSTVMSAERKVQKWLDDNAAVRVASQNWSFQEIVANLEQLLLAG